MKLLLLVPALLALAAPLASAQTTITWTGAQDSAWSNASNWSPAQTPGALDHVVIAAGGNETLTPGGLTIIDQLTVNGGTLTLADTATLRVLADATFNGGTLSFALAGASTETLEVQGNLTQTAGLIGTTTSQCSILVAGDWMADSLFNLPNGWVKLNGADSNIGGAAPAFYRVELNAGVNTLLSDVTVTGHLKLNGGTTAGSGWVNLNGSIAPHGGGSNLIHQARVVGGLTEITSTTFDTLELVAGTLRVVDTALLAINGDIKLIGGTLDFATAGASLDTIDVAGDLIQTGTVMGTDTAQTRITVAGNWQSTAAFVLPNGWIYLDGGDATIGGTAPSFHRLNLISGVYTLLTDIEITGQFKQGNGTTAGTNWVNFNGSVAPHGGGFTFIHHARIVGGTNTFASTTFDELELVAGTLLIADTVTLAVNGDARLIGGVLDFATAGASLDTLDIQGNLIQTGTVMGTTTPQSRILLNGDWTAESPFVMDEGWVQLDGTASSIGGAVPAFKRLNLPTGVKTVNSKTVISGTLTSTGGSSTGPEWFEIVGNVQDISTGVNEIHKLRIVAGAVPFKTSQLGELVITGGELLIQDAITLSVSGNMSLLGGTLDFATAGASLDTLDIQGDFFQNGGFLGTATDQLRIYCAGNWRSDTGFTLFKGWVYLDGLVDTTIDGLDPSFNNLRITNAKRSTLNGVHIRGDLEVQSNATLELLTDIELGGNLTCTSSGTSILGPANINMTATGFIQTNSTPIPHCNVTSGVRTLRNSTISSLDLVGGELLVADTTTCHILGDVNFGSGILSFATAGASLDTLDIEGNLSQSAATIGTTSAQARIFVAGNWMAANPFELAEGWVYLDGGAATVGGPAPTFKRLHLLSGVKTINTDTLISGTIVSSGGSTDGPAYLECTANVQAIATGANIVNRLRVASGVIPFQTSRFGELEVTGGEMRVNDAQTITIDGNARLLGGTLSWATAGASIDYLDVNGNLIESGTLAGTTSAQSRFRVAGDWTGTGAFKMPLGRVQLDGSLPTTIGGSSPAFQNIEILNDTRTMLSDVDVDGDVDLTASGVFDVASRSLDVAGTWKSTASGTQAIGTGPILFSGDGGMSTNAAGLPPITITGGVRSSFTSTVEALTLSSGSLVIQDTATLHVLGDAAFNGGSFGFATAGASSDTLDVDGNLTQVATTIGTDSSQSRIYLAGNWTAASPFELASGWVNLDGGNASIGGANPMFKRLRLVSGIKSVNTDTLISGTIASSGGSTAGTAFLDCTANVLSISTGSNLLNRVRVSGGLIPFSTSRIGDLEITGGELRINDAITLTVDGNADLIGGTLSFATAGGSADTLDIAGNLTQTGTIAGTATTQSRLYCAGDWSSTSSFAMPSGTVYLDGSGTTQLAGAAPTFSALRILNGVRQAPGDSSLSATTVTIQNTGTLEVTGDALRPVGTSIVVDGTLAVTAGGRLAPDSASSILVNTTGSLELRGEAGNPAILEGLGGDLACTVNGTISAREFEVRRPAASGLVLMGSIAAAPDDLRNGLFTLPSATPGSTLLTLNSVSGSLLPNLGFTDPLGVGTFNVRRTVTGAVGIVNAAGGFAGAAFEDDVSGVVNWTSATPSVVNVFGAAPGAQTATLSWTTATEDAAISTWRVMSGPTAAGPWSLVADVAPAGPSSYSVIATGLSAGVTTYFRLLEVQGGVLNLQGSANATPWSASLPPNVVTVGPGGTFATIQDAVNAATGGSFVVSVAAGTYPSFSVFAPASAELHIIPDGSGPVLIDASLAPIDIGPTVFGQVVELVGLDVTSGSSNGAVFVHDNLGTVLLDSVVATAGAGQAAVHAQSSLAVNVGRCTLVGFPGLSVGASASVYVGRGTVDQMDLLPAASVETCGLTPGVTNVDPAATLVVHAGVMPDISVGSFQSLASPFTVTFEAAPATFYQIATGVGLIPLDLGDPSFWQMLLAVNFTNYTVVGSGFTNGVTGLAVLPAELPGDPALLGATLPLQGWAVTIFPTISVRFSNVRTVVAMP